MPDLVEIFEPTVPLLEGFLRGTVIYLAVLTLMRTVGQREAGGLGITDVLVVVLVAEAAAPGLHGDGSSVADSLALVAGVVFWSVAIDAIAFRSPRFARLVKSRPKALIRDGEPNRRVMRRELMTDDELASQLRLHGIEDVRGIEHAYIEPNGMISIVRHDGAQTEPPERPEMD